MIACSSPPSGSSRRICPASSTRGIPLWDSSAHMDLMGDMEETFKISIGTADVLDFSSYEKGKEILAKYGVEL